MADRDTAGPRVPLYPLIGERLVAVSDGDEVVQEDAHLLVHGELRLGLAQWGLEVT